MRQYYIFTVNTYSITGVEKQVFTKIGFYSLRNKVDVDMSCLNYISRYSDKNAFGGGQICCYDAENCEMQENKTQY